MEAVKIHKKLNDTHSRFRGNTTTALKDIPRKPKEYQYEYKQTRQRQFQLKERHTVEIERIVLEHMKRYNYLTIRYIITKEFKNKIDYLKR